MSKKQKEMNLGDNQEQSTEVDKYEFEPIQGYPMLRWKGKRPFRSTQYYPAQLKEVHGPEVDGWRNKIYWGDNLQVMSHLLKEYRGKVDLIYIDPPYDSKADYKKKISLKGRLANSDHSSFEEKQYTDIWTNDEYLQFSYERLVLAKELLSQNGSLYVHIDWRKNAYIKLILDEIFGPDMFRNSIIWHYGGRMMHKVTQYNRKHDVILFYSKTSEYYFDLPKDEINFEEYAKSRHEKIHADNDGKRYLLVPDANMDRTIKQYEDEIVSQGRAIDDVWNIRYIRGNAKERQGYPTQKPEELLERIIAASSKKGDIVFDCFMGSGTTQAVAMKLGRRFIGADINLGAIQTTTKRLIKVAEELEENQNDLLDSEAEQPTYYTGFEVYNVNHYDIFRNPIEAKELLIEALEIQKLEKNNVYDGEKDGRMVKIMPVNRIATKADLNDLIANMDYKAFERRQAEHPTRPVEKLLIICMGHEPDLAATLQNEVPFPLDIEVVDILRDKSNLEFKREAEAKVVAKDGKLIIEQFYPMNLLQKLSLMKENVEDWRELVESVMVDWNYDGAVLEPAVLDLPDKNELVKGEYEIPEDAGTIMVKITDLLSESLEVEVQYG